MRKPLLTLFSTPKPFTDPHIAMIQKNAVRSWQQLGDEVEIVLIGEEKGVKEVARELNVHFIPEVKRNKQGTPLVSSIFEKARNLNSSPLLGFFNTDIIIFPGIIKTCKRVIENEKHFVLAGQRWDLKVESLLRFELHWEKRLMELIKSQGKRHKPAGSDYFIFPKDCYQTIPDFAIGRAGWDNWMIYKARWEHWKMIDATGEIDVIHQDHDYSHLLDGKVHRKQPETLENIKLMGGRFASYSLLDADYRLENHNLSPQPLNGWKLKREIMIFPSIQLHSKFLGRIFYFLFNVRKVIKDMKKDKKIRAGSR